MHIPLLLFTLTEIIFAPRFYDPTNVPKLVVLAVLGIWAIRNIEFLRSKILSNVIISWSIFAFIVTLFVSSILTDNLKVAFLGDTFRRNGFLTYFFLFLVFIAFAQSKDANLIKIFFYYISVLLFISGSYGIIQILGKDFVGWTGSGGIFSTYGNSNFAGAIFALLTFMMVGQIITSKNILWKIISFFNASIGIVCLFYTNARQGYLVLILLLFTLFVFFVKDRFRFIFKILIVIFFALFILISAGIFNWGPFASTLYKSSIGTRIFYWEAALKMFLQNPIFGVGVDRYGAYFNQFRSVNYPLKYGWDLTSSNAHNVPLQILSTGGVFVFISYLIFIGSVSFYGFKYLQSLNFDIKQKYFYIYFSWIGYLVQAMFSIDNISISLLGWILGGLTIGTAYQHKHPKKIDLKSANLILVSNLLLIPIIIFSSYLWNAESKMWQLAAISDSVQNNSFLITLPTEILGNPLLDDSYKSAIGLFEITHGKESEGIRLLENNLKNDIRDQKSLTVLANFYLSSKQYTKEISVRKKIESLDPWNAKNLLAIMIAYQNLGDQQSSDLYKKKILSFASDTDVGLQVKKLN